jgi:hypothetical protein
MSTHTAVFLIEVLCGILCHVTYVCVLLLSLGHLLGGWSSFALSSYIVLWHISSLFSPSLSICAAALCPRGLLLHHLDNIGLAWSHLGDLYKDKELLVLAG